VLNAFYPTVTDRRFDACEAGAAADGQRVRYAYPVCMPAPYELRALHRLIHYQRLKRQIEACALKGTMAWDGRRIVLCRHERGTPCGRDTYPPRPHKSPEMAVEQDNRRADHPTTLRRSVRSYVGTETGRYLTLLNAAGVFASWLASTCRCRCSSHASAHARQCLRGCVQMPLPTVNSDLVCSSLMVGDVRISIRD